jgi:large subunit ribosomal protein L6
MSRIGKKPIAIPSGVSVTLNGTHVSVKGPKGSIEKQFPEQITIKVENNQVHVERQNEEKLTRQLHGTVRALINTMIEGVEKGYEKKLVLNGIGFKANLEGENLVLSVGYSHTVTIKPLPGVKITVSSPTEISVTGVDKQAVGQIAAEIRAVRKPEPYLGKGISYKGEHIRRKEGKKAGKK